MMNWMNWMGNDQIIRLASAILLTSVTGGIVTLVWCLFRRLLERWGYGNLVYRMLKAVMVFYLFPIAYVIVKALEARRMIGHGCLFMVTPALLFAARLLTAVWITGIGIGTLWLILNLCLLHRKRKGMFPCTKEEEALFLEIYRKLGGKGTRLRVCRSYRFQMPCLVGVMLPVLVLPADVREEKELKVVFTHEIIHYKQKDVAFKWVSLTVLILNLCNPMAWLVYRKFQKWSEFSCDFKSCDILGDAKYYFGVIKERAIANSTRWERMPQLSSDRNELAERMRMMVKLRKNRRKACSRTAAAGIVCLAFMLSSLTAGAAVVTYGEQYARLYRATVQETEEEYIALVDDYVEYTEMGNVDGVTERIGEIAGRTRSATFLEWTVKGNELVKTEAFTCNEGDVIELHLSIRPKDISIKVGVYRTDGSKRYINATGAVYHEFKISETGSYSVFIENPSGTTVSVDGYYQIVE